VGARRSSEDVENLEWLKRYTRKRRNRQKLLNESRVEPITNHNL